MLIDKMQHRWMLTKHRSHFFFFIASLLALMLLTSIVPIQNVQSSPQNLPPIAYDQNVQASMNTPVEVTLLASDDNPNDELTATIVSPPINGTLSEINQDTGTVSYTPNSGITGQDSFTFKVNDGLVDSNNATAFITVKDTTPPEIAIPKDMQVEASEAAGAKVTFDVSAVDNRDGPLTPKCTPGSGSVFPIGNTTVTCTAKDSAGNPVEGNFIVKVRDTTAPELEVPRSPVEEEATSSLGTSVNYNDKVNAEDAVDASPKIECTPLSDKVFKIGDTKVTCTATDAAQNKAPEKEFIVTVAPQPPPGGGGGDGGGGGGDGGGGGAGGGQPPPPAGQTSTTQPIVINVPQSPLKVKATSSSGIVVNYPTSAKSSTGAPLTPSCAPPSGFSFPVGNTTVTCTAQDKDGSKATKAFTVAVAQPTNATAKANNLPPVNVKVNVLVVVIDKNQYDLNVISTSNVSDLAFNAKGKQISFVVSGQSGTRGFTEVPVGMVLEGPYNVTYDGASLPKSNFTTRTDDEGITNIRLNYTHSDHNIAIIGEEIVGQNGTSIATPTPPAPTSPFSNPIVIAGIGAAIAGGVGAFVVWRLKRRKKEAADEFIP